jgi:hypothetical protein
MIKQGGVYVQHVGFNTLRTRKEYAARRSSFGRPWRRVR